MTGTTDSHLLTKQLSQRLAAQLGCRRVEVFVVVFLDKKSRVTTIQEMFKGASDRVTVNVAEVVRAALRSGAHEVVISHNHTHGCPKPSDGDCRLTQRLRLVLALAGVPLRDHIIVAGSKSYSMSECGPWTAPLEEFAALTGQCTLEENFPNNQHERASRAHRIFQRNSYV